MKPTTFDYVSSDELEGQCTVRCVTDLLLREWSKRREQEKLLGQPELVTVKLQQ